MIDDKMNKLKVAFLNFWPEIKDENIFLPILQKNFDVEITTQNPDVIIHSIFGDTTQLCKYKCKKILFIGENKRPIGSNFSISFDPHTPTNYRLPLWQFYLLLRPELKDKLFGPKINYDNFDRTCSFVVSNPNNFIRNAFFSQMSSSVMHVFSYGRYMTNNRGLIEVSIGKYWRDAKYEFMQKYKHRYAIAFENNVYPYYCTEKLMDAFLAGSLPIYYGDPKIKEDWNINAFINANKGTQYAVDLIKKQINDDSLFQEIYQQPIFTDEQKKRHIDNIENFEYWLIEKIKK